MHRSVVTFRKPIDPDIERNLNNIPRKQRAMVRKGIKNGLRSEFDPGVERFFELFAGNVHRQGTPALPRRYFALLRETFGDDCRVLTVLDAQGTPVSSVLTFYWRDEVLPYYAGDAVAARALAANDFKYWELLRDGSERATAFRLRPQQARHRFFDHRLGLEPRRSTKITSWSRAGRADTSAQPKYRLSQVGGGLPLPLANLIGPHIVKSLVAVKLERVNILPRSAADRRIVSIGGTLTPRLRHFWTLVWHGNCPSHGCDLAELGTFAHGFRSYVSVGCLARRHVVATLESARLSSRRSGTGGFGSLIAGLGGVGRRAQFALPMIS